jgi:hypothetical protein
MPGNHATRQRSALSFVCVALAALAAAAAAPADAEDCGDVIQRLRPLVTRIADPQIREAVIYDLRQAHFEIMEGDEDECAMFVIHAARLMGCRC